MPDEQVFRVDITAEIARHFDDSSLSNGAQPKIFTLVGGPAVGKTTMRKADFSTGYVVVDAAEIYLKLCEGKELPFPGPFDGPMQMIGAEVARRAIAEKRNIVTEILGADQAETMAFFNAMEGAGYRCDLKVLTCPVEEAVRRNEQRGYEDLSCYFAEPYHRAWLKDAALSARGDAVAAPSSE